MSVTIHITIASASFFSFFLHFSSQRLVVLFLSCFDQYTCTRTHTRRTIRVPAWEARGKDGNPTEPILEAICPTLGMESWLQARRRRDEAYWEDLGVGPRSWYFGSSTGAFRIWPARHSLVCGVYDPRVRPW